jgi:hypothetical protein
LDFKGHLESTWDLTLEFIAPLIIITLVMFALWLISFGILAPVTLAGYTQSLLKTMREGRDPRVQDLFAHFNLFLPLLGFSLSVFAATLVGLVFLVFPGVLVAFAVAFVCLFALPLMTDQNLGLFQAIRQSYDLAVGGSLTDHLVVVIIYLAILAAGSAIFVGSLFTQPFATLFLLSVYTEKVQT